MKSIILLFLLLIAMNTFAQHPFGPDRSKEQLFYFELIGGAVMPSLTNAASSALTASYSVGHSEGISLRYQLQNRYSISSQFSMIRHEFNYGLDKSYQLVSNQLSLFVPAEIEWNLAPYREMVGAIVTIFAGPFLVNNLAGNFKSDEVVEKLGRYEIPLWSYGVETGIGCRIPVFSMSTRSNLAIKASYYHGMNDSFELTASANGEPANLKSALLAESTFARNSGFRITLCYEFALKKMQMTRFTAGGNGKSTYDRLVVK